MEKGDKNTAKKGASEVNLACRGKRKNNIILEKGGKIWFVD